MCKTNRPWEQGYVQVYTGDGKGKTTAALGLALRAAGAGAKVFIAQFAKGRPTSEMAALQRFADLITVKQYGREHFIMAEPEPEDIEAAQQGLEETQEAIASGDPGRGQRGCGARAILGGGAAGCRERKAQARGDCYNRPQCA